MRLGFGVGVLIDATRERLQRLSAEQLEQAGQRLVDTLDAVLSGVLGDVA